LVGVRFGELTFFPQAGCYPGPGEQEVAHLFNIARTTFRAPLTKQQRRELLASRNLRGRRVGPVRI
jgi:DNA-binding FadR family transcriptional regulator